MVPPTIIRPGFAYDKAMVFGVIHLIVGAAAIILGVVLTASRAWGYHLGTNFWCGCTFIIAGVLGVMAARRKDTATVVSFTILSVVSAVMALVLLALCAVGIASDTLLYTLHRMHLGSGIIVHVLVGIVALVEVVTAIAASVIGCKGSCYTWYAYEAGDQAPDEPVTLESSQPLRESRGQVREEAAETSRPSSTALPYHSNYQFIPIGQGQQIAFFTQPNTTVPGEDGRDPQVPGPPGVSFTPQGYVVPSNMGGFSQIMYVMPSAPAPAEPVQPPSYTPGHEDEEGRIGATPPPSYSQIDITAGGDDDDIRCGRFPSHSCETLDESREESGDDDSDAASPSRYSEGRPRPLHHIC